MFKRVIVASDLSKESNLLVNSLGALKSYGIEKCLLLQFWGMLEVLGINSLYKPAVFADFEKKLEGQKEILVRQGYSVETRVLSGLSINEINKIAVEENYSAIVVGTDKYVFSGMANELIHNAQKPILLIKLAGHTSGVLTPSEHIEEWKINNNVLFPTDFSKNAELALAYLVELAAKGARKITLLHVQDEYRISPYLDNRMEEFNRIDTGRLEGMKKILTEKTDAEVKIALKYGMPSVEILKLIKEDNIELVVMGSQGRGFVKEFFLGSVSHNIARQSPSSVLLIPAKR